MNLEESNSFVEQMEKNNQNKKTVLTIFIICAVLIVILLGIIAYIKYQDSKKLKMFVDDKQVSISSTLLIDDNGKTYMNIKELSNMLGYSYQKGEYKNYDENANSCNIKTPYEVVSMTADNDILTKYIINEEAKDKSQSNAGTENFSNNPLVLVDEATGQYSINMQVASANETVETFSIREPIQYINDELYVSFDELSRIFNVQLDLSETNRIKVYSLNYLALSATKIAENLGYTEVSNTYENLTAMIDNMLVVGDGTNYGVVSLQNGQEIISLKYEKMVYMQNTEEFFVTAEGSVGIVSNEGNTIIKPTEYDNISNLDELNKLYLVEKDGKYGVLNQDGDTVIYAEYDKIGIEDAEEFQKENVRNFNLLFDECIPVQVNGKMGMIDMEGNENLKCVYDSLGYVSSAVTSEGNSSDNSDNEDREIKNSVSNSTSSQSTVNDYDSVLTIPESVGIKGVVVKFNGLYGIYDVASKRLLMPCVCTKIYSKTKSGVTTYYLESEDKTLELESYLIANNLKTINHSNENEQSNEENVEEVNQENNQES